MNNTTNNTTDNTTNIILIVLVLLVSFFLSFLGGYYCANNKNPEVITKLDTITIVQRDTLVKTEFIKVKEENTDKTALYKITIDSLKNLLSLKTDSTTVDIKIPITSSLYSGKDSINNNIIDYKVFISGYNTSLDSLYFDVTTTRYDIVNTVIKQQHWKLYGETGLELLYTKNTIPIFNLGLGLEYSKNKIDVGISGGFNASYEDSFNPGFYVKTLVRYNFLKF